MPTFFSTPSRLLLSLAIVVSGALAFMGCDSVGPSGADGGQLTVLLTDASATTTESAVTKAGVDTPGNITKAEVTIERVAIVPSEDSEDGDAEEGGLEVLSEGEMTVDLTTLQDGVTEMLGEVSIPEGDYSQIRLVTAREATVNYVDANGGEQEAALTLPSADETGIKVNFDTFSIDDSADDVEITLDFSVDESFVQTGETGNYLFKPVVQAEAVVTGEESDSDGTGDEG